MKKKLIAWLLIITGGVFTGTYLLLYILGRTGQKIEFTNEKLYNFWIQNGVGLMLGALVSGIIMIVIGRMILKREKARMKEEKDEHELNPGEVITFKYSGKSAIVIVTNQRVRYYGYMTKELSDSVRNMPESDREDYEIALIKSVRAVDNCDTMKSRFAGKVRFGIQLTLTDGRLVNIPAEEQEELTVRIDNARQMASA